MTGKQHYIKLLYKIIKCLIEMNVCEDLYSTDRIQCHLLLCYS